MAQFPFEEKNFLGNRMRELRLAFGFKQDDVARALSVSRSTYSYYETGTTRPDPAVLGKLSFYYDVPISAFYESASSIDMVLHDSEGRRRRTTRSPAFEVEKVADLKPMERSLILFLRAHTEFSARDVLESLQASLLQMKKEKLGQAGKMI